MKIKNKPEMVSATPTPSIFPLSYAQRITNIPYKVKSGTLAEHLEFLKKICKSQKPKIEGESNKTFKSNLYAHACGLYTNNEVHSDNLEAVYYLLIDFDEGNLNLEDFDSPYACIAHESPTSTDDNKKWHLIFPLKMPIENHWSENYEYNCKKIFPNLEMKIDKSCKDVARRFFIPAKDKLDSFEIQDGKLFDYEIKHKKAEKPKTDATIVDSDEESPQKSLSLSDTWRRVEKIIDELVEKEINIAPEYVDWVELGFTLADISEAYYERGLAAFKKLSSVYDPPPTDEECEEKFQECLKTKNGSIKINSFFFKAKELGCGIYKKEEIDSNVLYLVKPEGTENIFHIAYKNTKDDKRVKLEDERFLMEDVIQRLLSDQKEDKKRYELTYDKISTIKVINAEGDTKQVPLPKAKIKVDFNVTATSTGYILGEKTLGIYAEKGQQNSVTLLYAKHFFKQATPKFHKEIDDYLEQLPYKKEWLEKYIYWFKKCEYALPMLYSYGESDAGKTFLAPLFGSLIYSKNCDEGFNKDFFKNPDFCSSGGDTLLLLMDEGMKIGVNQFKEFITSKRTEINQKNKGKITLVGFHRLITTENAKEPNLPPTKENEDSAALKKRIQFAKYNKNHLAYIQNISSQETKSWVDSKFIEHCEWVVQKIGHIEPEDAVFALKPYDIPEMMGGMSLTKTDQLIRQQVLEMSHKKEGKEIKFRIDEIKSSPLFERNNEILTMTKDTFARRVAQIFHRKGIRIRVEVNSDGKLDIRIPKHIIDDMNRKLNNFED